MMEMMMIMMMISTVTRNVLMKFLKVSTSTRNYRLKSKWKKSRHASKNKCEKPELKELVKDVQIFLNKIADKCRRLKVISLPTYVKIGWPFVQGLMVEELQIDVLVVPGMHVAMEAFYETILVLNGHPLHFTM